MLDKQSLSQLKQLKQDIKDSKEYGEGIVKGTQRKFGFVVLEDGREIFLNPEQMQRVFPGDRVKILIVTEQPKPNSDKNAKPKVFGTLEKLLHSPLTTFTGRYVVKGQGHFVEPDLPNNSRWVFIPPAARNNAKAGDYIYCKLSRHPWQQGKPQAKILKLLGSPDKAGVEADYVVSKFNLEPDWPKNWQQHLPKPATDGREDLTAVDFMTIDAASTQDMDDALYVEAVDDGWQLSVAVADPGLYLPADSPLDKAVRARATSVYLPGHTVSMLPRELANELCSLAPGEPRAALVCQMQIDRQGTINHYQIVEATIVSKAKLSYHLAGAVIDGEPVDTEEISAAHQTLLAELHQAAKALMSHRQQHNLVIPPREEFFIRLNDERKLDRVETSKKTSAHGLVEECMIAANRCAADFLGEQGLFVSHGGFRSERLPDAKKLAEEQLSLTGLAFNEADAYKTLMQSIDDEALAFPLRAVLSRLLERSRFTPQPGQHFGMGMDRYTTFTSPIRKYSDLLVHRLIRKKLHQQSAADISEQALTALQQTLDNARQARFELEQWLKCQYMEALVDQTFDGVVTQINSNGFSVRLEEHLIEGFVETRLLTDKFSYDPMRLRLSSKQLSIQLEQPVRVSVSEVDCQRRQIRFTLAEQTAGTNDSPAPAAADEKS